jgi:hypothetical protein
MKLSGSFIVSFDFSSDKEGAVIVGRQKKGKGIEIVNAFHGQDARELLDKLTTKEKKDENKN